MNLLERRRCRTIVERAARGAAARGTSFVPARRMRALLEPDMRSWSEFAGSWDRLERDTYTLDEPTERERRYSEFRLDATTGSLALGPPAPHFQTRDANRVFGGIPRTFAPMEVATVDSPVFRSLASIWSALLARSRGSAVWHVEIHQIRVRPGSRSRHPTPEGVHHDGRDWVLVLLVDRQNVFGGRTSVRGVDGEYVTSLVMADPLDTLLIDDRRVRHHVGPVLRDDATREAHRDVLVATFVNAG